MKSHSDNNLIGNHCIHLPKLSLKNLFVTILIIMFLFLVGNGLYEDTKTLKSLENDVIELREDVQKYHQNNGKTINFQQKESIFSSKPAFFGGFGGNLMENQSENKYFK